MRKTIVAVTVAAGSLAALGLGATAVVGAEDAAPNDDKGDWVHETLSGLVDDGTINQSQADAVENALEDAEPEHGPKHGGPFGEFGFGHEGKAHGFDDMVSTLADSLGIDQDELRSDLRDGKTIAEIADDQGVDVAAVVDDLVAAQQDRVDQAVAGGDLTREEADDIMSGAEERFTDFVNGKRPGRWGGGGHHRFERDAPDQGPGDTGPEDTSPDDTQAS